MGAKSSRPGQTAQGPSGSCPPAPGIPVAQSLVPVDPVPWTGPQVQYTLLQVHAQLHNHMTFGWSAGMPLISTNVESYYPQLAQMYGQGLELTTFYRIPGAGQARGYFSYGVDVPFQGIFTRDVHETIEPRLSPRYQLRIEKSLMQTNRVFTGTFTQAQTHQSNTEDLHQKIIANTQNGGRLVCIELTGSSVSSRNYAASMMGAQIIQGVDLFFHVPVTAGAPNYSVQCISVPINMRISVGFGGNNVKFNIDWTAVLAQYLNQGWRLIEIFLDQSQSSQMRGFMSADLTMNSLWFFEKETTRLEDPTPLYQGCVVPYKHKIKTGFTGAHASGNWSALLEAMGQKGWELACILETPSVQMKSLTTYTMDLFFFFQRPMLHGSSAAGGSDQALAYPVTGVSDNALAYAAKPSDTEKLADPDTEPGPPSYNEATGGSY